MRVGRRISSFGFRDSAAVRVAGERVEDHKPVQAPRALLQHAAHPDQGSTDALRTAVGSNSESYLGCSRVTSGSRISWPRWDYRIV
jgi:hypothetical protein